MCLFCFREVYRTDRCSDKWVIRTVWKSGRYSSASEVVRDALRHMEEYESKLAALRAHLAEGETQAMSGEFVKDFSMETLIAGLD